MVRENDYSYILIGLFIGLYNGMSYRTCLIQCDSAGQLWFESDYYNYKQQQNSVTGWDNTDHYRLAGQGARWQQTTGHPIDTKVMLSLLLQWFND